MASWQSVTLSKARLDLGSRSACIVVAVALSIASGGLSSSITTLILLCLLTVVVMYFGAHSGPTSRAYLYALVAEGVAASAVILLGTGASDVYIIYIAAPAFLAGLRGGLTAGMSVVGAELLAAGSAQAQMTTFRPNLMTLWVPWLAMAFSVCLLGAWIRQLHLLQKDTHQSPYASAHRLLGQLRSITRELSGGLDIEVVSESVLSNAMETLGGSRAALLLRGESDEMTVVGSRSDDSFAVSLNTDPLVRAVSVSRRSQQQPEPHGEATHRFRACLPITIGTRLIGLVVVDGPVTLTQEEIAEAQELLDDEALRLESAMLFSEVRALATVEERRRLAREIHDGIAQEIASLGYLVDDLARDQCNREHQSGLVDLRYELTRVVTELRLSIFDLRSGVTTNAGLGNVLGDYVREVGKNSGMAVHLSLEESRQRLRLDVETELLRIAQEAVTNSRKHSHAANLWVTCRIEPPFAEVRIEDDGRGNVTSRDDHYGLHIMKERAARINAVLTLTERTGGGTVVSAVLLPAESVQPIEAGEAHALHRLAS